MYLYDTFENWGEDLAIFRGPYVREPIYFFGSISWVHIWCPCFWTLSHEHIRILQMQRFLAPAFYFGPLAAAQDVVLWGPTLTGGVPEF